MVRRFNRKPRLATYKNSVKHSSTLLSNIGSGSVPSVHTIYFTEAGIRSTTGGNQVIQEQANTSGQINTGDIVKYVNICVQVAPRLLNVEDNNGWLEWALVRQQEVTGLMGLTNLGTQTLQDTANKQFRNNCMLTGCIPLGLNQGNSQDMKIKIPKMWEKIKIGGILILFLYFRSVDSTDVRTDSHRIVVSSIFKAYS